MHNSTHSTRGRVSVFHFSIDLVLLAAVMVAITSWLWGAGHLLTAGSVQLGVPVAFGVMAYLGWIGMYKRVRHHGVPAAVFDVSRAVLGGAAGFSLAGFIVAVGPGARRWVILTSLLWWAGLLLHHGIRAACFATKRRVVVAGGPGRAEQMADVLRRDQKMNYEVVGFVVDEGPTLIGSAEVTRSLGAIDDLPAICSVSRVDEVVFCLDGSTGGKFAPVARMLNRQSVDVSLTGLGNVAPRRMGINHVEGISMVQITPAVISGWRMSVKRLVDLVLVIPLFVVFGPLMAVVAAAIRIIDGVPPIFRQERIGKNGVPFTIFKFQTMVPDAEALKLDLTNELDGPIFKMERDPRITKLGSLLRKTSIDELPQLMNVLRGDMSLVGPRPFLEAEVVSAPPSFRDREVVTPGMTGHWQVHGRSDADFGQLDELDRWYVDNWSLSEDLKTLAKTVPAVLRQKGAR